jgi:hypothetical protein
MNFDFYLLLKLTRSRRREPEPEPKLRHFGSSSGSGQKFRFLPAPAPQHWFIYCSRGNINYDVFLCLTLNLGGSQKFITAPAPAKSFGPLRLRLRRGEVCWKPGSRSGARGDCSVFVLLFTITELYRLKYDGASLCHPCFRCSCRCRLCIITSVVGNEQTCTNVWLNCIKSLFVMK